jgi:hypothetical protein
MKKIINHSKLFVLSVIFLFSSCSKHDDADAGPTKSSVEGKYSGVIYTSITKTPNQTGPNLQTFKEKSSRSVTVTISKSGDSYLFDGKPMSGGPKIFYLSNDGDYELDIDNKTIKYSYYRFYDALVNTQGMSFKYKIEESREGTLK